IDVNMFAVGDPAVAELFLRGDDGDPTLTRTQMFAYLNLVNTQLFLAEDQFYQHSEGLIGDDHHAGLVAWLKYGRGVNPGFRAMWEILRGLYRGEFRAFIDGTVREAASISPPDVHVQWLASVATERERTKGTPGASP
ncbi:MAG: hypothetical protein JSR81_13365, partial [Proteobacteria bacterium]|nr:hypothetical protein [Pseudomonadota bacterium]